MQNTRRRSMQLRQLRGKAFALFVSTYGYFCFLLMGLYMDSIYDMRGIVKIV
jgi:hypothetical protein